MDMVYPYPLDMVDYLMAYTFKICWVGVYRGMDGYWKEYGNYYLYWCDVFMHTVLKLNLSWIVNYHQLLFHSNNDAYLLVTLEAIRSEYWNGGEIKSEKKIL